MEQEQQHILGIDWAIDSPQYKLIQEGVAAERARIRKAVEGMDSRDFDDWSDTTREAVLNIINSPEKP